MAKNIMIQGTMSNAGKSLIAAGLCRIFHQAGFRVAPFKSQNMALNSFITASGGEMGRAQVVQAEAAGIEPDVRMNPILLKPTTDVGSQVIVGGVVQGNMRAMEYYRRKREFIPAVLEAYRSLEKEFDIIVIEGAGSPAEINLKDTDIVNMGLARLVDAPVLLVGDIDRGGVFAQLYGTIELLEPEEKQRVKGTIVNKFRGDRAILQPGIDILERICGVPVAGVVPYVHLDIDDEDSLSTRFQASDVRKAVDIAVIRLPRISNFTDFSPLERYENVSVRYVERPDQLHNPDMILLPGTKSTIADLLWLRQNGLEAAISKAAARGCVIFGICGGYQMLGRSVSDPEGVEAAGLTRISGLGLLDMDTVFRGEKVQRQTSGTFGPIPGVLHGLTGLAYRGYEIHMGRSAQPIPPVQCRGNVYGSYVHGIFDADGIADAIVKALAENKGVDPGQLNGFDPEAYKQRQYDLLADTLRAGLDMDFVYKVLNREV
ncbi:MAG: cobyric acid synthase [Faecousia sp.]